MALTSEQLRAQITADLARGGRCTVEILHLDRVWRTSMLQDLEAYPGATDDEKIAWLNQRCWPQTQRNIWRLKTETD